MKTSFDISCESSAKQTNHMKYQNLFSLKNKNLRMSYATNFAWHLKELLWVILFVCVEVLRPSQPNGVMSSAVSLPNHTFTGQA